MIKVILTKGLPASGKSTWAKKIIDVLVKFELSNIARKSACVYVEDVKGIKTDLYKWKKKCVEAQYGIKIIEI